MPENNKKDDLRVFKTQKALLLAMSRLLKIRNFNQITVNNLCEEAMISRTTFYSHYKDKYDLLKFWLEDIKAEITWEEYVYKDVEKSINGFVSDNKTIVKNLLTDANSETSELLCGFLLPLLNIGNDKAKGGQVDTSGIVFSSVCCGGVLNYLLWQVKNKFPAELPVMNPQLYELLVNYKRWDEDRG